MVTKQRSFQWILMMAVVLNSSPEVVESPSTEGSVIVKQEETTIDPVGKIRHLLPKISRLESPINVTVQVEDTAFLPCRFLPKEGQKLADDQVSWFRRRDWHILTAGTQTYTNDARFTVLHKPKSYDWTLQIKYTTARDNGTYECQLSTGTGVMSQFVNLHIVVPRAIIKSSSDYHVQPKSSIQLTCIIQQTLKTPKYIYWYHNDKIINYNNKRSGISFSFEVRPVPQSHLTITDAKETDTGNYTCASLSAASASVNVYVSHGDKIAAIQRRNSCINIFPPSFSLLLTITLMFSLAFTAIDLKSIKFDLR